MAGRRRPNVEQSGRAAPPRSLRRERSPHHAPHTNQGRGTDRMILHEIVLRIIGLPLIRPYQLSYRTFTEFEPIIVEMRSVDGHIGWGEGHISPGSSSETREGGWAFCREHADKILGKDTRDAKTMVTA